MKLAKHKDWMLLNFPCLLMCVALLVNTQYSKEIILYTGYIAAILLILLLSLNPLIRLLKVDFLRKINRYRRIIGVAVFVYTTLHVSCFFIKKGGIDLMVLFKSPVLFFGFITFLVLIPLAITSNNLSIKILTLPKWRRLHKLTYLVELALFVHIFLQLVLFNKVRTSYILVAFSILFLLQLHRIFSIRK